MRDSFEDALLHESEERVRWLARLEPPVRSEVEAMLGWHDEAGGFLEAPAALMLTLPIPERVGNYRIVGELGTGGMGSVFRAVRADELYEKEVAVKLLEAGPGNRDLVSRFRAERRILAQLDHPNVAKLLDGGASEDGRPYFVMELVDGQPIDRHCDGQSLGLEARVRLFLKVCSAVAYAHQNLVVHRDLKPSNLLITADGEPKLLDFGIAKLLAPESSEGALLVTAEGMGPLTPAYASPEQVLGQPIGSLADVYSLGVLLYELLAGSRPIDVEGRPLVEVLWAVAHEPPRPASQAARQAGHPRRARRLAGDLDNILARALEKEPSRRYGSVVELAADLEAWLEGRPVRARPSTFGYRTGKLLRRHRGAAIAAALALAAALGFVLTLWRQREELLEREQQLTRERNRAEAVSTFLTGVFEMPDPTFSAGESVSARQLLDRGVAEIDLRLAGEPEARADLLLTMARTYRNLGLPTSAEPLAARALEIRRGLTGAEPGAIGEILQEQAEIATLLGRYSEAGEQARRALELRRTAAPRPGREVENLVLLARIEKYLGRYEESGRLFQEALGRARSLGDDEALSHLLVRFAELERARDHRTRAEALLREALELRRRSARPVEPRAALVWNDLGLVLLEQGKLEQAEAALAQAQTLEAQLFDAPHPIQANTLHNLALLRQEQGRFDQAEALYRRSLEIARVTFGPEHAVVATTLHKLGALASLRNRYAEAEALLREALALRRRLLPADHADIAATLTDLGLCQQARGHLEAAGETLREALERSRAALGEAHSEVAIVLNNLGLLAHVQGNRTEARDLYRRAIATHRASGGAKPQDLAAALHNLGSLAREDGDLAAARESFGSALEVLLQHLGEDHLRVAMCRLSLADVEVAAGRPAEGEKLARRALAVLAGALPEGDPWRLAAGRILDRARAALSARGSGQG
ncbi:MAG TPA: serine/threonine-protein kinase [Thermoanaerobaculia bacterium]|nr:serine/threonine-protein kinase [Thermoanaerobaculia bacterium]